MISNEIGRPVLTNLVRNCFFLLMKLMHLFAFVTVLFMCGSQSNSSIIITLRSVALSTCAKDTCLMCNLSSGLVHLWIHMV